jgi:hypothetical protein
LVDVPFASIATKFRSESEMTRCAESGSRRLYNLQNKSVIYAVERQESKAPARCARAFQIARCCQ